MTEPPQAEDKVLELPATHKSKSIVYTASRASFRVWLQDNHTTCKGIYLAFPKKNSGVPGLMYDDAVEEALCFGWIDATKQSLNETFSLQLFTPRKKGSTWSAKNKKRIEKLSAEGHLQPAGERMIETAKLDGSWTVLDAVERLEVPDDLAIALKERKARGKWDSFSASSRKSILWWITSAKRQTTRTERIEVAARMAAKGLRARIDVE
eukprot:TRINITY_DN3173_c0_g1_i1.p1 TRINITY_DN3173_c0_g1~~TRINITY_DN3173_c0_g1_i1.p1  ORF type:complete len:240 (-),score=43.78 TRINITY_DN3173_c0_g1_i1:23-649(-)